MHRFQTAVNCWNTARISPIWTASALLLSLGGHCASAGDRADGALAPSISGPLRQSRNPNYFEDASGTPLVLCGSHTWNTLQDWGTDGAVRPLDFDAFVNFVKAHGHNFTLLWTTELPTFHGLPSTEKSPPDFTVSPFPWIRTGPGMATDGRLKFDLTKFDQAFFDRFRTRVQALGTRASTSVSTFSLASSCCGSAPAPMATRSRGRTMSTESTTATGVDHRQGP